MTDSQPNPAGEPPRATKTLPVVGFILTAAWIALVVGYVYFRADKFAALAPNEIGDFAAGVFAPLAFLWLVLGFFQQGEELRHSGKALWLQGRELQNSVEQQRELVEVTREQLQFESKMLAEQQMEVSRNARPILRLAAGGSMSVHGENRRYEFILSNHGNTCTGLKITVKGSPIPFGADVLERGGTMKLALLLPETDVSPFEVTASYLDARHLTGSTTFLVGKKGPDFSIEEVGNTS